MDNNDLYTKLNEIRALLIDKLLELPDGSRRSAGLFILNSLANEYKYLLDVVNSALHPTTEELFEPLLEDLKKQNE